MPVFGMVLVTTAMFSTACSITCTVTPDHQHGAEFVFGRVTAMIKAPQQQCDEQENDQQRADKPQLFADDGKDKVVVRLRQIQMFLPGIADAPGP